LAYNLTYFKKNNQKKKNKPLCKNIDIGMVSNEI
jgi:hypothetical protein